MQLRMTESSLLALTNRHVCLSLTSSMCAAILPFLNFSVYRSRLLWRASAAHIAVPWNNEEQGSSPLCNYPVLKSKSQHKQKSCGLWFTPAALELSAATVNVHTLPINSTAALKMQASTVTCFWCDKHEFEIKLINRKWFGGCVSRVKSSQVLLSASWSSARSSSSTVWFSFSCVGISLLWCCHDFMPGLSCITKSQTLGWKRLKVLSWFYRKCAVFQKSYRFAISFFNLCCIAKSGIFYH